MKYKKGFEIRLTVSEEELDDVNNALLFLGFYPGNPFSKGRKLVIPVYGTEDFIRFMKLIGAESYLEDESLK